MRKDYALTPASLSHLFARVQGFLNTPFISRMCHSGVKNGIGYKRQNASTFGKTSKTGIKAVDSPIDLQPIPPVSLAVRVHRSDRFIARSMLKHHEGKRERSPRRETRLFNRAINKWTSQTKVVDCSWAPGNLITILYKNLSVLWLFIKNETVQIWVNINITPYY